MKVIATYKGSKRISVGTIEFEDAEAQRICDESNKIYSKFQCKPINKPKKHESEPINENNQDRV